MLSNEHDASAPVATTYLCGECMHQKSAGLLQIGYSVANDPELRLLNFWMPASGVARDGRWSCSPEENSYPALQHSLVHPCAGAASSLSGTPEPHWQPRLRKSYRV